MERILEILRRMPLFQGLPEPALQRLCSELAVRRSMYRKGETILPAGETVSAFGVVLSGAARLEREDVYGNREIVGQVHVGETFAEVFACLGNLPVQVTVVAAEWCEVLFLRFEGLYAPDYTPVLHRFLQLLAQKNYALTEKLRHVSRRTTREKLLSFLAAEQRRAGSDRFTIRFDRQQLADYLAVDRSAMCRELSRLKADGVLDYDRKTFTLQANS